jgi:LAO/AO transport system kinase
MPAVPAVDDLVTGVRAGDRRAIAKAITLAESTRPDHQRRAREVIDALLPQTGHAIRVGISGAPGVGKSTFIEALGVHLVGRGHRVAVLAVDPSSVVSGGSILGDKTRMEALARHPSAFIRPSPSAGTLGGVAAHTREAMLVLEGAGFDVIIVETVGVGQSETDVAGMTDLFVLLQLPNAGDELQAIKKGIVELADIVACNKIDIDPAAADRAMGHMRSALSLLRGARDEDKVRVIGVSALRAEGVAAFWDEVERRHAALAASGVLAAKRRRQALAWTWSLIDSGLRERFRNDTGVRDALPALLEEVAAGTQSPTAAANELLDRLERRTHRA